MADEKKKLLSDAELENVSGGLFVNVQEEEKSFKLLWELLRNDNQPAYSELCKELYKMERDQDHQYTYDDYAKIQAEYLKNH